MTLNTVRAGKNVAGFVLALCLGVIWQSGIAQSVRSVTDDKGQVVSVPVDPQRIVAISEVDLDALLALGITPAGTLNGRGQSAPTQYLLDEVQEVAIVGEFFQPNIEMLLQLQPDLILAGGFPIPPMLELLPEIAPTLITYDIADDWKTSFRKIATMLEKEAEHAKFMADYDARIAELRPRLAAQDVRVVSVVRWNPNGPVYMMPDSFANKILTDLGLERPVGQVGSGAAHSEVLSLEALHLIDGDFIFFGTLSSEGEAFEAMTAGINSAPYRQLNAVQQGNVLQVDGSLFTSMGGPLGAMRILDIVEENLLD